jgi:transglutaminase-like putative cysteine protease
MVAIATVTLAITEQVQPVALAITTLSLALTAWQRERSFAWQQNGPLLNAGLIACLVLTVALFARGQLAVIALAHFAVLAQGLQLLDRRARRSEFLLVALSVFQVVLAANLTDHLAFPPLLIAFTVSVVWTLVVHTLKAEALEAGEPGAADRALSGSLLRTTALASLLSVVLATALFPMLPRMRSGSFISQGIGNPMAVSGFSENVELGDLGRIRLDPQVVLRVEVLDGQVPPAGSRYWRGLAFDRFDGRRWAVTPSGHTSLKGDAEIGLDLGTRRLGTQLRQRITREKLETGVIFSPGQPLVVRGDVGRLQVDQAGSLYGLRTAGDRIDYQVAADVRSPRHVRGDLAGDRAALPREAGDRFLQLPELDPGVGELARQIVAGAQTDLQRALSIEAHLRRKGRYTNDIPDHGRAGRSPIESFLLESSEGHCEYFASGMVMLARSLGLPARLVNGFAGGVTNQIGDFIEVTQSDAHTWVEIHFAESGWVRFDPTPADLRLAGAAELRGERWWASLTSAAELWWYRIVDFDRSSQGRVLRKAWLAWHQWRREQRGDPAAAAAPRREWTLRLPAWAWGLGALLALAGLGVLASRRRPAEAQLPSFYARALKLLAGRGLTRGPASTARAFADRVAQEVPEVAGVAFRNLTEAYLRQRFSGVAAGPTDAELRVLRDSLRA